MNLTRVQKDELNALSKEIFGTSSRWQKLCTKGYAHQETKEVEEFVPGEKEPRKTRVPVKLGNANFSKTERFTVESILEYMRQRKALMEAARSAQLAKKEQEKLATTVHEQLHGSAI